MSITRMFTDVDGTWLCLRSPSQAPSADLEAFPPALVHKVPGQFFVLPAIVICIEANNSEIAHDN